MDENVRANNVFAKMMNESDAYMRMNGTWG